VAATIAGDFLFIPVLSVPTGRAAKPIRKTKWLFSLKEYILIGEILLCSTT
jgi:hypothetical protein